MLNALVEITQALVGANLQGFRLWLVLCALGWRRSCKEHACAVWYIVHPALGLRRRTIKAQCITLSVPRGMLGALVRHEADSAPFFLVEAWKKCGGTSMDAERSDAGVLQLVRDTSRATLVKQGAEARVYRVTLYERERGVTLPGKPPVGGVERHEVLLKHRFLKRYRHPTLSAAITVSRTISEARSLVRSTRSGVSVPRVELVDETRGVLGLEWIDGVSVRRWLGGLPEDGEEDARLPDTVPPPTEANQCTCVARFTYIA